jgi:aryl-phospho-beta-D-glucosidase BglC (GH1 family)
MTGLIRRLCIGFVCCLAATLIPAAAVAAVDLPPLIASDGVLVAATNGQQVDLKGANWFGFNVASGMLDGLWAHIDLATTTAQLRLLGFNTLRIPFDFTVLKNPAKDYRSPQCVRKDIFANTIDPALHQSRKSLPTEQPAAPPMPDLRPPGTCNSYVPSDGTAEDALVWVTSFLVNQGFYVVLNHHSLVSNNQIQRNPSDFAHAWANLWARIAAQPGFDEQLKGRVFVDITNEPDFMGMKWSAQPSAMVGASDMYLRVMDRLHEITPTGMLYFIEGTGQTGYSLCWGSGFVTDPAILSKYAIDDASPFLALLINRPYVTQVVISPHEYGPLIRKSNIVGQDLVERMDNAHGYLMSKGFCPREAAAGSSRCVRFPVVVGEFGSNMEAPDQQWLIDFAAWMRRQRSNSWIIWAVNANSGDTGGLLDKTSWQDLEWGKLRYLINELGLKPWWKQ